MRETATITPTVDAAQTGFMRYLQSDNGCAGTGQPCRDGAHCGCFLEMHHWCGVAETALRQPEGF